MTPALQKAGKAPGNLRLCCGRGQSWWHFIVFGGVSLLTAVPSVLPPRLLGEDHAARPSFSLLSAATYTRT